MLEDCGFGIQREGLANAFGQRAARIFHEFNPVRSPWIFRDVGDGVVETACHAHNRDRAIAQAVHLIQPAGFEAGWHEEEVTGGLDAMGQGLIVSKADGDF